MPLLSNLQEVERGSLEMDMEQNSVEQCLDALFEKDRFAYLGNLIQGFIHNVNGPLQNMSMLVELLERGQDQHEILVRSIHPKSTPELDTLVEKQRKRFQQLSQQINLLADMMKDFMVLHEIERNEMEVDLNLVLSKLATVFRANLFFKHQVNLELKLSRNLPLVRIPGRDLVPSLVHIFQNAITSMKRTPQKLLTIESQQKIESLQIRIQDTGCGFENETGPEHLFKLFHSGWCFEQTGCEGNRPLGFGLFAVRCLLDPYGVKVHLERMNCGTSAIIEIPSLLYGPMV